MRQSKLTTSHRPLARPPPAARRPLPALAFTASPCRRHCCSCCCFHCCCCCCCSSRCCSSCCSFSDNPSCCNHKPHSLAQTHTLARNTYSHTLIPTHSSTTTLSDVPRTHTTNTNPPSQSTHHMSHSPSKHSSDIYLRAAAEPKIVMAESHTSRNVESPLAQPVVDSTTGVDASKTTQDTPAVSGDTLANLEASSTASSNSKPDATTATATSTAGVRWGGPGGVCNADGSLRKQTSTSTATPTDAGSDVDRSGNASPSKTDRKTTMSKKPSFKPVSLNKQFLKDSPAAATATPASSSTSTLQPKRMCVPSIYERSKS